MSLTSATAEIPVQIVEDEPATFWQSATDTLERWGERLNPILVKETRQALKSKQFTITFVVLLVAGWLWSIGGVAVIGPEIFYRPSGREMFFGYYIILTFPLAVIVPFSAFRSLTSEQEDNTYEVLSITALSPRQIVTGKLGSALVQIVVYFSAIAPCIGFTYLLRGIDIVTLFLLLLYAFLGSLGLSAIGLLLGTMARTKLIQVPLSVLLLGALFLAFGSWLAATDEMLRWGGGMFNEQGFWIAMLALLNAYVLYFSLVIFAAAAQLNFPGDNGSTRLRAIMVLMQCCFLGWIGAFYEYDAELMLVAIVVLSLHWYLLGALMSGESPDLSLRVKRGLPQSSLGRLLFTWFNPGPGTGFVFVSANLLAGIAFCSASVFITEPIGNPWSIMRLGPWALLIVGGVAVGYVVAYLGLGTAVILFLRRFRIPINPLGALLIQVSLVFCCCFIPFVIQFMTPSLWSSDYTLLQLPNPFWTMIYLDDVKDLMTSVSLSLAIVAAGVAAFAFLLRQVLAEVRHVRIVTPSRVLEEEAELHPTPAPQPLSPWD